MQEAGGIQNGSCRGDLGALGCRGFGTGEGGYKSDVVVYTCICKMAAIFTLFAEVLSPYLTLFYEGLNS